MSEAKANEIPGSLTRSQIARRVARDIPNGAYVNLGIGIPSLVSGYIDPSRDVLFHVENGILGMGPPALPGLGDPDLIDAGKVLTTVVRGAAYFHHADAFAMLRGKHLDIGVIGALQVSATGDLANWKVPGESLPGVGGAMDVATGVRRLFVTMTHVAKDGTPKIVSECTMPLTARRVVHRIFTDIAVIDVDSNGLVLRETAPGVSPETVQRLTGAPLLVSHDLTEISLD